MIRLLVLLVVFLAVPVACAQSVAECDGTSGVTVSNDGTTVSTTTVTVNGGRARLLERMCETRTLRFDRRDLTLDATPIGNVTVSAWDRDYTEVRARLSASAVTRAEARRLLAGTRIQTRGAVALVRPDELDDRSEDASSAWVSADFEVRVPRDASLDLKATVGDIRAEGMRGGVRAETTTGDLTFTGVGGHVEGRTATGDVVVEIAGNAWGGLDVETATGDIDVRVPSGLRASVTARTTMGDIQVRDLPLDVDACERRGACTGARLSGEIGGGGHGLRVQTATGTVRLRRR